MRVVLNKFVHFVLKFLKSFLFCSRVFSCASLFFMSLITSNHIISMSLCSPWYSYRNVFDCQISIWRFFTCLIPFDRMFVLQQSLSASRSIHLLQWGGGGRYISYSRPATTDYTQNASSYNPSQELSKFSSLFLPIFPVCFSTDCFNRKLVSDDKLALI